MNLKLTCVAKTSYAQGMTDVVFAFPTEGAKATDNGSLLKAQIGFTVATADAASFEAGKAYSITFAEAVSANPAPAASNDGGNVVAIGNAAASAGQAAASLDTQSGGGDAGAVNSSMQQEETGAAA